MSLRSRIPSLLSLAVLAVALSVGPAGCASSKPRTAWWQFWRPKPVASGSIFSEATTMLPPPPEILDPPVAEGEGFRLVSNMDEEIPGPEGGAFAALMNTPPAEPIRGATAMPMSDLVTVHFAFDSAQLDQVAMDALSNNLSWLLAHPGVQIQIEGHCDERGTVEYNLLLGERRAQAVRAYLVGQGVPADSLHTISYGEERPLDPTPTETAFSMNRRAQFLVY